MSLILGVDWADLGFDLVFEEDLGLVSGEADASEVSWVAEMVDWAPDMGSMRGISKLSVVGSGSAMIKLELAEGASGVVVVKSGPMFVAAESELGVDSMSVVVASKSVAIPSILLSFFRFL